MNKHRDWRFELLRIIAMFLIVATHFYAADNWSIHTDPNLSRTWASAAHDSLAMFGQIGVSFFILISAYFLAFNKKNPVPRLIRLWIQIFIYSAGICYICPIKKNPTYTHKPQGRNIPQYGSYFLFSNYI